VPIVLKSGSLNLLEPSETVQACNGIAFTLYIILLLLLLLLLLYFILCIKLITAAYFGEVYILTERSKISGTDRHIPYTTLVSFALMYVHTSTRDYGHRP